MSQALDLAKVYLESAKCRGCSQEQKLGHLLNAMIYVTDAMSVEIQETQRIADEVKLLKAELDRLQPFLNTYA